MRSATVIDDEADRTDTEKIVGEHGCDWMTAGGDQGRCHCGLIVTTEDEWARHTEHAIIQRLWSPQAELITSETALEALPMRSTLLVHPGGDNAVFRRIVLSDPGLHAWCNLMGAFWPTQRLLPALVLERGPGVNQSKVR